MKGTKLYFQGLRMQEMAPRFSGVGVGGGGDALRPN